MIDYTTVPHDGPRYWALRKEAFALIKTFEELVRNASTTLGHQAVYEDLKRVLAAVLKHPFAMETLGAWGKSPFAMVGAIPAVVEPSIYRRAMEGLERSIRFVPDLPAEVLLAQAQHFTSESSIEAGWDNYSTAAQLSEQAVRYQAAAVHRHGVTDERAVLYATALFSSIAFVLTVMAERGETELVASDDDMSEAERHHLMTLSDAVGELSEADLEEMSAELAFLRDPRMGFGSARSM